MYVKPQLERFGTFRQITQIGAEGGNDAGSVFGIPGCNGLDDEDPDFGCADTGGGAGSPAV